MRPTGSDVRALVERLRGAGYATRVKATALALLGLTALLNNFSHLRLSARFEPKDVWQGDITVYEGRFEELKKSLPERGVVGYVSDETDEVEEAGRYYLTQHALAPLVVVRGADRPLVVGNFGHGGRAAAEAAVRPARVEDFGDGVVLFVRGER